MTLDAIGAQRFAGVLNQAALSVIERAMAGVPQGRADVRLYGLIGLQPILGPHGEWVPLRHASSAKVAGRCAQCCSTSRKQPTDISE